MPKVNISAGGVDSELDPERPVGIQLFREFGRGDDLGGTLAEFRELLCWIHSHAHSKNGQRVKTKFICSCSTAHALPRWSADDAVHLAIFGFCPGRGKADYWRSRVSKSFLSCLLPQIPPA